MSWTETIASKLGSGIIAGIVDALADFLNSISPRQKKIRDQSAKLKADNLKDYSDLQDRYAKLLTTLNQERAARTQLENEQTVAEKQAQEDAKKVGEVRKDEQSNIDSVSNKPDVLLRDNF